MDSFGRSDRETLESLLLSSSLVQFSLREPSLSSFVSSAISERRIGKLRYVVDRSAGSVSVDLSSVNNRLPSYSVLSDYPQVPSGGRPPHSFSALVEMSGFLRGALRVIDNGSSATVSFLGLEASASGRTRQERRTSASDKIISLYKERWRQGPCRTCSSLLSKTSCRGCFHTDYMIRSIVLRSLAVSSDISISTSRVAWMTVRGRLETPCYHCYCMFTPATYHAYDVSCGCELCEYIKVLGLKSGRKLGDVLFDSSDSYVLIHSADASAASSVRNRDPGAKGTAHICQACGHASGSEQPQSAQTERVVRRPIPINGPAPTSSRSSCSEDRSPTRWTITEELVRDSE